VAVVVLRGFIVSQLDYSVTAEKLEEIFRIAGNVLNVELKMDKDTNKFRGMATVRFEHPIESVQAICILNFHCCVFIAYELQFLTSEPHVRKHVLRCATCSTLSFVYLFAGMLSPQGRVGFEAKFCGLGLVLCLIVVGLSLVLGLISCGLVLVHLGLVTSIIRKSVEIMNYLPRFQRCL